MEKVIERPVKTAVTVRVPASSANLGAGFDCAGVALSLYAKLTFCEMGSVYEITGCPEPFRNKENLAVRSYLYAMNAMGLAEPKGLLVDIKSDIPVSRGLGSSSAMIVGGILAANHMHGDPLSKSELVELATRLEGHPDNVAPTILGGMIATLMNEEKIFPLRYNVADDFDFTLLIPDFELSTALARSVLPVTYNRADAIFNIGCVAVMLKAFETADHRALYYSLDDRIHQPYRASLIPDYENVKKQCMDAGADGMVISGAGSTLLAISRKGALKDLKISGTQANWTVCPLKVDEEGAVCLGD